MMDKRVSLKSAITLMLIAVLISTTIVYVLAVSPSSTFTISPGVYPGAPSFMVWREGSNYFAKDSNGMIAYSGSNAAFVIQSCHDAMPNGGTIFIRKGNYYLTGNIVVTYEGISIIGESIGQEWGLGHTGAGTYLIASTGCTKMIEMRNTWFFTLKDITLDAQDIADYCFYADNANNTHGGEAAIYIDHVLACGVGMGKTYHTIAPVRILNSVVIRITNSMFHHGYAACWFGSCADIWISNCDFEGAVVGLLSEFCRQVHIIGLKLEYNVASQANTDYAGTANAAALAFYYKDENIQIENLFINDFMRHGIRFSSDVVGPVTLNNIVINQIPSNIPISTSYGIWNQGCNKILASNIDIWDRNSTSPTNIAVYDQGNDNSWINVNVRNCTAAWSFTGSDYRIFRWNIGGKPTENSGTADITSSTSVTFSHGLAGTPTHVSVGWKSSGYGTWRWSATSTEITITVAVSGSYTFSWYTEYKP